jgi:hypothetical protein
MCLSASRLAEPNSMPSETLAPETNSHAITSIHITMENCHADADPASAGNLSKRT